jgi:hypothetical protein
MTRGASLTLAGSLFFLACHPIKTFGQAVLPVDCICHASGYINGQMYQPPWNWQGFCSANVGKVVTLIANGCARITACPVEALTGRVN